jgi:hypothetical protein
MRVCAAVIVGTVRATPCPQASSRPAKRATTGTRSLVTAATTSACPALASHAPQTAHAKSSLCVGMVCLNPRMERPVTMETLCRVMAVAQGEFAELIAE